MHKLLIWFSIASLPVPLMAQDEGVRQASPSDEAEITVLASGVRQSTESMGESVSIFDRSAIERIQGADITRLLEHAPGVTVVRNGGPGEFTGVGVRGADSEQLLVLIDGVRLADPAAPGGGFDFGNLLLGNLAKVELQRGSNSTIWGSDALGGVMAATLDARPGVRASLEYGANDTVYGTAAADAALGPVNVGVQASRYASKGFSAAETGSERDGFRQTEVAGHGTVALGTGLSAFARGRFAQGRLDIDGFPPPDYVLADTAEFQRTRQLSGVAGVRYGGEHLEVTLDTSAAQTRRANYDPALGTSPSYTTDGLEQRLELRGKWAVSPALALDFGGEQEWTRFASLFDQQHRTAISGVYAQLAHQRGPLHLAAGVRRDQHRDFGGRWSLGADAAYALSPRWRLTASYGEGFKAPTLFRLDSNYGNASLRPERSRSYDAGIAFQSASVDARLTAFRRDSRDLIGFVSCFALASGICAGRPFGTYDNIGRARALGIEVEGKARLPRAFTLSAAYTYLEATDRSPGSPEEGKWLARRPRHAATLSADWAPARVRLGADVRLVSHAFDDAANMVALHAYSVGTLRGEWDASRWITLYGRVENVGDARYQTAAGYATARRSAYVGARARL